MKKGLIILMAVVMLFAMTGLAFAVQENTAGSYVTTSYTAGQRGNITANQYDLNATIWNDGHNNTFTFNAEGAKTWSYKEQGVELTTTGWESYDTGDGTISTHVYGTWNSPYTLGIDGYNYNDAQDYTDNGDQVTTTAGNVIFTSGPHGGYLTTTHRCRECHAVHRAAGKFKLLRSDTRFEACDWCHGTGAGSGFNIQMDNDDAYTTEFNVGHTMGFGVSSRKWKAPDDTYPAYTPNYWLGGFSCFDCHSPHANPARLLGYGPDSTGNIVPIGETETVGTMTKTFGIVNGGHSIMPNDPTRYSSTDPTYLSGSWLLIKNPDREIATHTDANTKYWRVGDLGITGDNTQTTVTAGEEISDMIFGYSQIIDGVATVTAGQLHQFDTDTAYPVNKIPTDWDSPIGPADSSTAESRGFVARNPDKRVWSISEFCTDCHDGNAGLYTVQVPLFSEDRALREQTRSSSSVSGDDGVISGSTDFKGSYDLAYGHDASPRTCARQFKFNPEDGQDFGPNCRNCHKGSSACNTCHEAPVTGVTVNYGYVADASTAASGFGSTYDVTHTSTGLSNMILTDADTQTLGIDKISGWTFGFTKHSRNVDWTTTDWRSSEATASGTCSDDGFSWPHRTLGWKMLKDDLFGLDFEGNLVAVGESRTIGSTHYEVHDIDSVCLDCHNPTIWNASSTSTHTDTADNPYNDELVTRGLP